MRSTVSPLLRNSLALAVDARQIALSWKKAGWREFSTAPEYLKVDGQGVANDALFGTLAVAFEKSHVKGADVEIVVTDRFARYTLIPWSESIRTAADESALAAIRFEQAYGLNAVDWDVQVEHGQYGHPRLACALDKVFLSDLRALIAARGLRLRNLVPRTLWLLKHWPRDFSSEDLLLVSAEKEQATFATLRSGQWHSIRSTRMNAEQAPNDLPRLVVRESILQGAAEDTQVAFHAPAFKEYHGDWERLGWTQVVPKEVLHPSAIERVFWNWI